MALRVLYTVDVGKQPVDDVLNETLEANELDERAAAFTRALVAGTLRSRAEIDADLDRLAVGFPTVRQTAVDRNILRLAAAEILFGVSDAPPGAVVNEAVELAKKYSTADSGRFVNGVLGTLVREVEARRGTSDSAGNTEDTEETTEHDV
jgi:N utilization substance protein B